MARASGAVPWPIGLSLCRGPEVLGSMAQWPASIGPPLGSGQHRLVAQVYAVAKFAPLGIGCPGGVAAGVGGPRPTLLHQVPVHALGN